MLHSDLLLPSRTPASWKRWILGRTRGPAEPRPDVLVLEVRPGDYAPFSSFLAASRRLLGLAGDGIAASELRRVTADLSEIHRKSTASGPESTVEAAIVQHRGVLAALRRVSRESAQLCSTIHRAAVALLGVMAELPAQVVVLPSADRLDRPSLKLFGRSCLLASPDGRPRWEWWFREPGPEGSPCGRVEGTHDLWRTARSGLFTALRSILDPRVEENASATRDRRKSRLDGSEQLAAASIANACAWVAQQNYDACFLWAARHPAWDDSRSGAFVDLRRLLAIAAINVGQYDVALEYLEDAYTKAPHATLRAHLAYMIGLVHAKRKQDLASSARWYRRGFSELDGVRADDPGDADLERAWILNGTALNTLLDARFRKLAIGSVFRKTYQLVIEAFDLVREGLTPDRMYLRYNLLGNMGSLMEIQGEYGVALKLAEDTFDPSLAEGLANENEWKAMLGSRRAALHARSGNLELARALFDEARASIEASGCAIRSEILERSVGILDLQLGAWGRAREVFEPGLEHALELRSRRGAIAHGGGLVVALRESGETGKARAAYDRLAETEGLWLAGEGMPTAAAVDALGIPEKPFGLSLSIPEVDLEDLATISVARVLRGEQGGAPRRDRREASST